MKKNNKGFTLIEVIGVIIVLAIILIIVYPQIGDYVSKANEKSEATFINNLIKQIDSYISLNSSEIDGNLKATNLKITKENRIIYNVKVSDTAKKTYKLQDITDAKLIPSPIVNPNQKKTCDLFTNIKIYRDDEYVYCFKIPSLDCYDNKEVTNCPVFTGTE